MPSFPKPVVALYYRYAAVLNRLWPWIEMDGMRLRVEPSVYKPIQNETRIAALVPEGRDVLDVGCGSGVLGLSAASRSRSVLAVDINPAAVRSTRANAERLGLANVEVLEADVLACTLDKRFGVVVCGPPFSDVDLPSVEHRWASAPGFTPRLFARCRDWLEPEGCLIVHHMARSEGALRRLADQTGLELEHVQPNHKKGWKLHLLAWPYAQVGLRTTFYVFRWAKASSDA